MAKRYDDLLVATLELPRLGLIGSPRHGADPRILPEPKLAEVTRKTKDPYLLCVDISGKLHPLLSPMPYWLGRKMTHDLVRMGIHPLDIIVATASFGDGQTQAWQYRNAVQWLFWTSRDQAQLEQES